MANKRTRVVRTANDSKAALLVEDNAVSVIGDKDHFIVCDERGITLKGPISIVADAMGRRSGGLFVEMSDLLSMIPSTIVTPFPQKIPFPPALGVVNMAKDVSFFMALLV